jgi:hypothetical protein
VIARSASATVHRATDTRHGDRTVALKVFAPQLSADPGFRRRFRQDAARLGELRLPHVMSVHSYGVLDGLVYLDMRLVEGPTLAEARRRGLLDARGAAVVVEQLRETTAALAAGGLGGRPPTGAEVLLSGVPGQEFAHVVGLGLGREPVGGAAVDPAALVGRPPSRRRRPAAVAALGAALVVGAAGVLWFGSTDATPPAAPGLEPPAGQVLALAAEGPVVAAATAVVDGRPVVVGADDAGIRSWDAADGSPVGPVVPVAATELATAVVDGVPVVVSRGPDQLVRTHRLTDGTELAPPIGTAAPPGRVDAFGTVARDVATTELDGRPVLVAVEPVEAGVQHPALGLEVRALPAGEPLGPPIVPGSTVVLGMDVAAAGGTAVVVVVTAERTVLAFDARTGAPSGAPIGPAAPVTAATVVAHDDRPVLVVGGLDNTVRALDLRSGAQVGEVHVGHTGAVHGVDAVAVGGRTVLVSVSSGPDGTGSTETRFWDLEGGALGPVLAGPPAGTGVTAVDELDGRAVLVTGRPGGAEVRDVGELVGGGTP